MCQCQYRVSVYSIVCQCTVLSVSVSIVCQCTVLCVSVQYCVSVYSIVSPCTVLCVSVQYCVSVYSIVCQCTLLCVSVQYCVKDSSSLRHSSSIASFKSALKTHRFSGLHCALVSVYLVSTLLFLYGALRAHVRC